MINEERVVQNRVSFFDDLAEEWDQGEAPAPTQVRSFLTRLKIQPGTTILDIGTGTGLLIPYIFEYHPAKVVAIDLSARMLQKLTEKYKKSFGPKLVTLCRDVHNWDLEGQLAEVAICNGVFPHFYDQQLALSQIFEILKPNGILAINHFNGREFLNSLHAQIAHELICHDFLMPVNHVADAVSKIGFVVETAIDDQDEYCLIARKP